MRISEPAEVGEIHQKIRGFAALPPLSDFRCKEIFVAQKRSGCYAVNLKSFLIGRFPSAGLPSESAACR